MTKINNSFILPSYKEETRFINNKISGNPKSNVSNSNDISDKELINEDRLDLHKPMSLKKNNILDYLKTFNLDKDLNSFETIIRSNDISLKKQEQVMELLGDKKERINNSPNSATVNRLNKTSNQSRVEPESWGSVTVEKRKENIRDLRNYALELQKQGVPAPRIVELVHKRAAELYKNETISAQKMCDFIIQDLAIVFVGPDAFKYLDQVSYIPGENDLVKEFLKDYEVLGLQPGGGYYAGRNLDNNKGKGLRNEINDNSKSQIYHCFFYQFMAYVTNSEAIVNAGSYAHERKDTGSSREDHIAALVACKLGLIMRSLRDAGERKPSDWGEMASAAYGGKEMTNKNNPRAVAVEEVISNTLKSVDKLIKDTNDQSVIERILDTFVKDDKVWANQSSKLPKVQK